MVTRHFIKSGLRHLLLAVMLSGLVACNIDLGGSEDAGNASNIATDVALSGSVGDGPVTGATVSVYASDGSLLGTVVTDATAGFRSTVKARGRDYPLRLVVSGGIDLVTGLAPDFEMVSLLAHPSDKQANINPFTTFIVKLAESLPGGLSSANVDQARGIVLDRLGFGLDTTLIPDPFTTQIDAGNVANLVKASEALGELVRRTRDLTGTGANRVVGALSADLTDGYLDGLGASGTDVRLAAVANVAASQVAVETLSNTLRVGGVIATSVMDQSIQSTRPGISGSQLTGGVLITAQLLGQSRKAVAAAQVLDGGAAVQDVAARIDGLTPYSSASDASTALPASSTDILDNAVSLSTVASGSQLQEINVAASTGSALVNAVPLISGVPSTTVVANNSYLFQPTAVDSDGGQLSFSIASKPAWATFNTGSGRLSGTPDDADAGLYSNIVISVSDGTDTASLAAFSIKVDPAPVVNSAPLIGGVPAGSVMATSSYVFQPTATDANNDKLTFSITNKPVWASFNTGNGTLGGTPTTTHVGSYNNIIISVSDGKASTSLAAFGIRVDPLPVVNNAPVISGAPATTATASYAYSFKPSATDADGNKLTFSIANKPVWAAFSVSTGELVGTPLNADAGSYRNIVISVTDGIDTASLGPFSIDVSAASGSFTLSWTAPVARADGSPLSLSDIDGYRIYYGNSPGNYTGTVDVTDGTSNSATINNLPAGSYFVVMSTYDTGGLESDLSGEVPKTAQ